MRKALSFVLVLTLVLSSFSMAFAATPAAGSAGLSDIAGIANEEAIQVSYDLGIVTGNPDGTFLPTKAVNRAEFAAMITRALGVPDSALAGYTSTTFKDTAGYGWAVPYLAFAQSKGIMLGDGNGNVMPGRTINTNEAITMALRAIGYTNNSSELVGTWPSNYVTKAQDLGIYSDVAAVANVDKANAAQIIYNLLDEQKVAVNSDGDTNPLWVNGVQANGAVTLLNAGLDCKGTDEVVAMDGVDSLITLTPYVGAYATVYRNDGGDGDVVAVKPISTFLTGKFNSATEFEANDVKYVVKAAGTSDMATITNAAIENTTAGSIAAWATGLDEATIAVDVSGKTITKIYSVAKWVVTDHDYADSNTQDEINDDQELLGDSFDLDVNKEIDLTKFELVGVKDLASIAKDNVVYVYTLGNSTTADIVKVAVGTETSTGKFTDLDGTEFTVGGKTFELASDAGIVFRAAAMQPGTLPTTTDLGTDYDLDLDAYGNVYDIDATSTVKDNYAVVVNKDAGGFDDARVKLYLPTDEKKVFSFDDDTVTLGDFTSMQAIAYSLDKDGVIDGVTKAINSNAASAKLTGNKSLAYTIGATTTSYAVAADATVFTIDATTGAITNDISSLGKVKLNTELAVDRYFSFILNDDDEVVAMVVNSGAATRDADDIYAVVNTLTDVYDVDLDDHVQKVVGFADGAALDKKTDGSVTAIGAGDGLYKITYDADGYISNSVMPGGVSVGAVSAATFSAINSGKDALQIDDNASVTWYDLAADVVVYEKVMDGSDFDKYVVSSASKIKAGASIAIYDVNPDDEDGYDYVIWQEN